MSTFSASAAAGPARPLAESIAPVHGQGRPTAWWGIVCMIMTEGTIFAGLIGSYFFLRASSPEWPQGGLEVPKLGLSIIFSLVLWGSSIPMIVAERGIKRGQQGALRVGLLLAFLMGAAFLLFTVYDFNELHFGWRTNAYGSIYYTTVGLHALHVLIGLAMSAVVQLKARMGKFSAERHMTVQVYALYWHFVDAVWVFVFASLVLSPHIR
jgi:heme/copper-type cytochrome/quinol oxidase subunit 3